MAGQTTSPHLKSKLFASRVLGEVTSAGGGRATTWCLKHLLSGPHDQAAEFLASRLVLPHLSLFEKAIDRLIPAVETDDDRTARLSGTPHDRARHIAESMLRLGSDFTFAYLIQVLGQSRLDSMFAIENVGWREQAKLGLWDRSTQIGSFLLLNPVLAETNIAAQGKISTMLRKVLAAVGVDMSDHTADKVASHVMNVRLPNAVGSATAGVKQYQYIMRQQHQK